jgi:hypothetical protein
VTEGRRHILIVIGVAIGAFLIGAGWQYLSARRLSERLTIVEREAAFNTLAGTLAAATIDAQQGSYEIARQHASDFFTRLQAEIGRATSEQEPSLQEILAQRDATITALSRADPQAGPMLERLFTRFRLGIGHAVGPEASEPTPPPPLSVDSAADTTTTTTDTIGP